MEQTDSLNILSLDSVVSRLVPICEGVSSSVGVACSEISFCLVRLLATTGRIISYTR
jgi:hypothetical protein